jgi:type II secretory pathway pseudopilin PulG
MLPRQRAGDDRGETLLELIVAVVIMGIAVVAIVGGITTSVLLSDMHRKQATAGGAVRNYGEAVEKYVASTGYVNCASSGSYAPGTVGFTAPSGYVASANPVRYWNDTSRAFSTSCATDGGVQAVALQVRSSDNRATETLTVMIRKPCRPTDGACS